MRLLDLFCGAGGAAMGYHRAGFDEVVGVDIDLQPDYPFMFVQGNALRPPLRLTDFDFIHASPPCQRFSRITREPGLWPDLVDATRQMLDHSGVPYIIENVPGAPLRRDVQLCGSMFGLDVQRHRVFELGGWATFSAGGCNHKAWKGGRPWTVVGHMGGVPSAHSWKPRSADQAADLLGMPRGLKLHDYAEAVPPAYTEYLGRQFIAQRRAA